MTADQNVEKSNAYNNLKDTEKVVELGVRDVEEMHRRI